MYDSLRARYRTNKFPSEVALDQRKSHLPRTCENDFFFWHTITGIRTTTSGSQQVLYKELSVAVMYRPFWRGSFFPTTSQHLQIVHLRLAIDGRPNGNTCSPWNTYQYSFIVLVGGWIASSSPSSRRFASFAPRPQSSCEWRPAYAEKTNRRFIMRECLVWKHPTSDLVFKTVFELFPKSTDQNFSRHRAVCHSLQ